jgi:cytochrome c oxidase subunit 3
MLFISFFWTFFHSSLSVSIELGAFWPPEGINAINPWSIPLLGSTILLASGFILTLSHHSLILGDKNLTIISLIFTIIFGIFFILLQYTEYNFGEFTISDSIFGSIFYMTTGLHAIHVIIGVLFLIISLIRIYLDHYTIEHHIGFEFAIYYWHLVDVIWLLVFLIYYWWGS